MKQELPGAFPLHRLPMHQVGEGVLSIFLDRWRLRMVANVALSILGLTRADAQTTSEARAAAVLASHFETVVYANSDLLATAEVLNSGAYAMEHKVTEQKLRLPFLELIGALTALDQNDVQFVKGSYSSVMVGAKDCAAPEVTLPDGTEPL